MNFLKPKEIKTILDEYVIGQDHAKSYPERCCLQSL